MVHVSHLTPRDGHRARVSNGRDPQADDSSVGLYRIQLNGSSVHVGRRSSPSLEAENKLLTLCESIETDDVRHSLSRELCCMCANSFSPRHGYSPTLPHFAKTFSKADVPQSAARPAPSSGPYKASMERLHHGTPHGTDSSGVSNNESLF